MALPTHFKLSCPHFRHASDAGPEAIESYLSTYIFFYVSAERRGGAKGASDTQSDEQRRKTWKQSMKKKKNDGSVSKSYIFITKNARDR